LRIAGDIARQIDVKTIGSRRRLVMMSKCANPQCPRTFIRMNGGRFFGFLGENKAIENFWLCSHCAAHYTLRQIEGRVELLLREKKTA
jgi:hypothetical protein